MPEPVVHRPAEALNSQRKLLNSSRILILGLARKPNVDDERESPSYVLVNLLSDVPVIGTTREHSQSGGDESVAWDEATLPSFALVLIATNHACVNYRELADWVPLIVDTRNAMATALSMKIAASANA